MPHRSASVTSFLARPVHQLGVGREGDVLRLHRGVNDDAVKIGWLHGASAGRDREALLQQGLKALLAHAVAPAGDRGAIKRQGVAEEFLAAEILIIRFSTHRSHTTSSLRLKVCLRMARPAISRVGSGGRPGLSVYTAPNFSSRKRQSIARASFPSSWFKSMIWSSRARNKSCPPLSRRSRGRIRSSAPKPQEHRIRAFDSRESRFRFCKEIDPNPKKSGKIKRRISPTCSHRSGLVRVFHSQLDRRRGGSDAQTRRELHRRRPRRRG